MRSEEKTNCHDCGAKTGENHKPGCDTERCPACGGQAMMCLTTSPCCGKIVASCCEEVIEENELIPWTGIWPGVEECREFGWYSKMVAGKGWVECDKDDPEASENLNRLHVDAVWSRKEKRFVKRG